MTDEDTQEIPQALTPDDNAPHGSNREEEMDDEEGLDEHHE